MRLSFFLILLLISSKAFNQSILVGSERFELYIDKLKEKNIAVACNSSSRVGEDHLIDVLVSKGLQIKKIFAPEHGFRGDADAGAHVVSSIDSKTGISIKSLYGESKKPTKEDLKGIDAVIFDIQDVGVRFYTYISTLQYLMESCGENRIPIYVMDRPNPNGHYVDGPVLNKRYKSFVGMQAIPIVYGMTIGEYAQMLVGEKWLNTTLYPHLEVIPCLNYTHSTKISLTSPPSPNLKSTQAIALYPSLCILEGTDISVGRGTETPFEIFGSPYLDKKAMAYSFTPQSVKGATNPPFLNQICYGENLTNYLVDSKLDLSFVQKSFQHWTKNKTEFFLKNLFFDKLAGDSILRKQILSNQSERNIRASWEPKLSQFKTIRKKYLLYSDFSQ